MSALRAAAESTPGLAGLRGVAYSLPRRQRTIGLWGERRGEPAERIEALIANGVFHYYDADDQPVAEMAAAAIEALVRDTALSPDEIDVLIFTHTLGQSVACPPNSTTSFLQRRFGFARARCFSLAQQNCVSIFAGLKAAHAMMAGNPAVSNVVIVTADHVPAIMDHHRAIGDVAVHSDGACALLLTRGWPERRLLGVANRADAQFYEADITEVVPNANYYISTIATMRSALSKAAVRREEVSWLLPNHVRLPAAHKLMDMLRLSSASLYTANFAAKGHVFGADPFINLVDSRPAPGDIALLCSTGTSGCYGAAVIAV